MSLDGRHKDRHKQYDSAMRVADMIVPLAFGLVLLLTGCGVATMNSTRGRSNNALATATSPATSPSPSAAPSVAVRAATPNGCPVKQAPSDATAPPADVFATQASAQPISMMRGQILEIRLLPGVTWKLVTTDPAHTLTATGAEGWYSPSAQACIWRFTASHAGNARLTFSGLILCSPANLHCVAADDTVSFVVSTR